MKKITLTLLTFAFSFSMFTQTNSTTVFAVDVRNCWADLRAGAGINHEIIGQIPDKAIVFRDTYRPMRGNWIPVIGNWNWLFYSFRGFSREGQLAYMHKSVLMPIQEPYASRLQEFRVRERCSDNFYDGKPTASHQASLMSFHIPNIFLFDDGECNRIVWDFDAEKNIFEMYIMDCYDILFGDTIGFYRFFNRNMIWESRIITPMLAVYRLFRNENGEFGFYTELLPQPRTISIEKAQQIVATIRQAIVIDLDGDAEMLYLHENFEKFWQQLFLAYASGVKEARDIINASGCDASICLDLTWIRSMFDAFRRSKLNPRR